MVESPAHHRHRQKRLDQTIVRDGDHSECLPHTPAGVTRFPPVANGPFFSTLPSRRGLVARLAFVTMLPRMLLRHHLLCGRRVSQVREGVLMPPFSFSSSPSAPRFVQKACAPSSVSERDLHQLQFRLVSIAGGVFVVSVHTASKGHRNRSPTVPPPPYHKVKNVVVDGGC